MMRMWFGLEIDVVGLPPLPEQPFSPYRRNLDEVRLVAIPNVLLEHSL